ncbi:MAG: gamma-glutamylcyclotransferase family protein [Planctomycetota bacterium]
MFVYGSLLPGEPSHGRLSAAARLGEDRTLPECSLFDLGDWPALVLVGASSVRGEVFEVKDSELSELDAFEGHPELFRRERLTLASGREAFVYVFARDIADGARVIPSGDWRRWRRTARDDSHPFPE